MTLPLEKLQLTVTDEATGKNSTFPALHPQWKDDVKFLLYQPLTTQDTAAKQEWIERTNFIINDFHWLLRLPHDKFWCQVVFDYTLHGCIDSYLKYAPRPHDQNACLTEDVRSMQATLHRLVFMACLRMATHKESKDHFMSGEVFGDILYENFIFDIPKLMDLCVLYGRNNEPLLSKMIENIFKQQPKYQTDLIDTVPTIQQVFDNILQKFGINYSNSAPSSPVKLNQAKPLDSVITGMPLHELQDVVYYLTDTAATLWAFLEIYPHAAPVFHEQGLTMRISDFYEKIVPILRKTLKERNFEVPSVREELNIKILHSRGNLLKIFHQLVFTSCVQVVLDAREDMNMTEKYIEEYLEIISTLLSEKRFLADYETMFPFAEDLNVFTQLEYPIDETRIEFLKEGIAEACSLYVKTGKSRPEPEGCELDRQIDSQTGYAAAAYQMDDDFRDSSQSSAEPEGACAAQVMGIELESLISSVKDLLPDLGSGFIQVCLEEFSYDVEKVINAVLEDKLPESVAGLDRNMEREPEKEEEESLLDQRLNKYDNDEFDVFRRDDIDTSRIILGKKDKTSGISLDDKSEIEDIMPLYRKYGNEIRESMYENNVDYDDEYDDTYDTNQVGADDADSADELTIRRPFTTPLVLSAQNRKGKESSEDSQEGDSDDNSKPRRDEFVQDPAKLRELQAQRAASRYNSRHGNHRPHQPKERQDETRKNYDVKGKPKGQGQESEVVRNRAWKEKNKSTRVHHNRKALSDKKRQKGMGPLG